MSGLCSHLSNNEKRVILLDAVRDLTDYELSNLSALKIELPATDENCTHMLIEFDGGKAGHIRSPGVYVV